MNDVLNTTEIKQDNVQKLKEEGRLKPFPEDLKKRHEERLRQSETTVTDEQVERALVLYRDAFEAQDPLPPMGDDWPEVIRSRNRVAMRAVLEDFANG